MKTRNALLSVYHKDGIIEFATNLISLNFRIYASGGTCKHLKNAGLPVKDIARIAGGKAILGHRVVTLSRNVHAGLLAREIDREEMRKLKIPYIDLLCVDLYPLREEVTRVGCTLESVIEQTDVGGPAMLHAAAKGQRIVVADPDDRPKVIRWLKDGEPHSESFRERLCATAEYIVAEYCLISAHYRSNKRYNRIAVYP